MEKMNNALSQCRVCPRNCGIDRTAGKTGFCRAPYLPKVALVSRHDWEEPPISGTKGSGTIFFSHCNLNCVFCQNHDISQDGFGQEISVERLAEIFLEQQERGFHNINLVSAVQFIPQVAKALAMAKTKGLSIPVVYNSNGYESLEGLKLLEGLVDVYLPDFKYWDNTLGLEYSRCPHYRETATAAIMEMRRQVGKDILDENGIMQKGIIIRHLVLPNHYKDSFQVLDWIRNHLGEDTFVSLMSQYTPMHKAKEIKALSRKLTTFEYDKVVDHFFEIGLKKRIYAETNLSNQRLYADLRFIRRAGCKEFYKERGEIIMIKKDRVVTVEGMRGGAGSVEIHHILEGEELMGHGTLYARVIIKPHSSIGWHQHVGNTEPYYILKGVGTFVDNDGSKTDVYPGDVCTIEVGHWHSMENNTDEDMEMMALVLNEEVK